MESKYPSSSKEEPLGVPVQIVRDAFAVELQYSDPGFGGPVKNSSYENTQHRMK